VTAPTRPLSVPESAAVTAPARRRGQLTPATLRLWVGITILAVLIGGTFVLTQFGALHPERTDPANRLLGLGAPGHLAGTDQLGRDLLARTLAGFRWSFAVAAVATVISFTIGTTVGVTAAAARGTLRTVSTRLIDICIAFPYLVVAVTIIALVDRGFWALAVTLGIVSWPLFVRVVFAESLSLIERDYVLAAQLVGVPTWRSLLTHVLPGVRPTLLVVAAFTFADLLIAESALSFLGIGAPIGKPSLGNMLADGRLYLVSAPRMTFVPAAAIVFAVIGANLIGDGVSGRVRERAAEVGQ
jgi:peptide/nickel transport system permease protein